MRTTVPNASSSKCRLLWLGIVGLFLVSALSHPPVYGQAIFGSMVGYVTDASSASVPGATVTVTLVTTNDTRTAQTDAAGVYTISTVVPGTYRVEISHEGFSTFVASNILVNQNNVVRVDAHLQVGALTEKVEVTTTAAAQLQTDRADVHAEISGKSLIDLPQPNRSYQSLLVMIPGSTALGGQVGGGTNDPSKALQYSFNGSGTTAQVVRLEGMNTLLALNNSGQTVVPSVEAIENVNVTTNSSDAEQVGAGGSTVSVMLRSGSNQTHGGLYEYNTLTALQGNNFFANQASISKRPHYVDNDLGGFLGGHVIRNKFFYFGSYEGDFNDSAYAGIVSIPNQVQLTGNMTGSASPIYDPSTGTLDGKGRTPFPGKIIPTNRISPVVQKIIPSIPTANTGGYGAVVNNYYFAQPSFYNLHKIDTKVDYVVNSKLRLSGRFGYQPYNNQFNPLYGDMGGSGAFSAQTGAGNYLQHGAGSIASMSGTYVVSPTFVIDATVGRTSSHQVLLPIHSDSKYALDTLGIPGTNQGDLPWYGGIPQFQISNFVTMGNSWVPLEYVEPTYEDVANATKIKGPHTIRFGGDFTDFRPVLRATQNIFFNFTGGVTTLNGGPGANPYNAVSDFLLGLPYQAQTDHQWVTPYYAVKTKQLSLYVRDQWQVSRKFTVNYGVRWEYHPIDTRNADYNGPLNADGSGLYFLNTQQFTSTICGTKGSGLPTDCGVHASKKLFGPSIGIAYRPYEKFVIRAGYSLAPYNRLMGTSSQTDYPADSVITQVGANPYSAPTTLTQGYPLPVVPVGTNGVFKIPANTGNLGGMLTGKDFTTGYVQSYNFTVQGELPGSMLASVGYIGTHAVKLFQPVNINYGQLGGGNASQPFAWVPDYNTITTFVPWGEDVYNSLQATLNKRLSQGLSLQAAYTYSKDIGMNTSILIPKYIYYDHTLTALDRTNHLAITGLYELPFGNSKPFATHGVGAAILGGWSINAVFNYYSGAPFSVTSSSASCNCPGNSQTADQVLANVSLVGNGVGGQAYFNPLAYTPVTGARFGTSGFFTLRGPGSMNLDASIFRSFRITERFRFQIRAQAYNATNTPHFGNPGTNVSNLQLNSDGSVRNLNGFSQITTLNPMGRQIDPRYMTLGARLTF